MTACTAAPTAAPPAGTLVLTEVMALGGVLADEGGEYPDWIEIFNPGGAAVDLTGWFLTDSRSRRTKWTFPSTSLSSGQYLVVFASGKDRAEPGKPLHTSFSLSAAGEYLGLVAPDGVSVISELPFPAQRPGYSYGLADQREGEIGQGVFFAQPTPGGPNGSGYAMFASKPEASVSRGFYEQPFTVALTSATAHSAVLYTLNGRPPRPADGVAISVTPADLSGKGDGTSGFSRFYPSGTVVRLTAPATAGGFRFQRWLRNGMEASASVSLNVTLDDHSLMNAVYGPGPLAPAKVHEAAGYQLLYSLNLPDQADYSTTAVPYEIDHRGRIRPFKRIAYYLELQGQGDSSTHFLWASMDAFTSDPGQIGVPTRASGAFFQQAVTNMSVRSSLPGIVTGDSMSGGTLEFWPNNYGPENEAAIPGASSAVYDFGDTPWATEGGGYGSLQLHNSAAGQTLFAFNGWGSARSANADVGIGNFSGEHSDWTFAANAAGFAVKRLQVYVLENDFASLAAGAAERGPDPVSLQSSSAASEPGIRSLTVLASNPETGAAYIDPIEIHTTRTLRAASFQPNAHPSEDITETYIFVEDVLRQPASLPGHPNPEVKSFIKVGADLDQLPVRLDHEMDPTVVNAPAYRDTMAAAMRSIPSLSLVGRLDDFFGRDGVYYGVGSAGGPEIPISVELLYPEEPSRNLQIDAGLRPHSWAEIKRSFRLIFRNDYGQAELESDLFRHPPWNGSTKTDRFRRLILRAGTNRSFATVFNPDDTCYTRDEWARASQLAMSGQAAGGLFVHLYINGLYWGLYNPVERPDHFFAASYFGGDAEDYFAVNHGGPVSGDAGRWDRLTQEIIKKDMAGPANYEELKEYLDVEKFCDYLILNWYAGTADWPENNWYASMRLTPTPTPLRFFVWDAEDIWDDEGSSGPFDCKDCPGRGNDGAWIPRDFVHTQPTGTGPVIAQLFHAARANPEFLTLLADRAHRHLQTGGALSDAESQARWLQINEFIREAVMGESARWGDARDSMPGEKGVVRDRDGVWEREYLRVLNESMPGNAARMIAVLRAEGYYPPVDPPRFNVSSGAVEPGRSLEITSSAGTVYYTLDGRDPREPGGAVSSSARAYTQPLVLTAGARIYARLLDGQTWSALAQAEYSLLETFATWQARYFASGDPWGDPGADPDGDGLGNLAEYAYGRDPLVPETDSPVSVSLVRSSDDSLHLELSFKRRASSPELSYLLEISEDAQEWRTEPGAFVESSVIRDPAGPMEHVTFRVLPSVETLANRFIRIGLRKN